MAGKDDYVTTLTEASLKKAKEELYEDPKNRMGAVETFRKWINDQPHIKCPTDNSFLLRFLRPSKFSQLEGRKMLEKFLTAKRKYPQWLEGIDMNTKKYQYLLKSGYVLVPPGFDKDGRRVIIYRMGVLETSNKHYGKDDVMTAWAGMALALVQEENTQVNGFTLFIDMTDFSMKALNFFGVDYIKKVVMTYMGAMPTRLKAFHYYNTGAVFEALMGIMLPVMEQKMRDRLIVHGSNLESIYDVIPKEMLPVEYLPDDYTGPNAGTIADLTKSTMELISKHRDRLLSDSGKQVAIDPSKKRDDVPVASFRALSTD